MKTSPIKTALVQTLVSLALLLLALPVSARNYNYDILAKATSLHFDGAFTVKRDGATVDVSTLKPGDEIVSYSNIAAYTPYDYLTADHHHRHC